MTTTQKLSKLDVKSCLKIHGQPWFEMFKYIPLEVRGIYTIILRPSINYSSWEKPHCYVALSIEEYLQKIMLFKHLLSFFFFINWTKILKSLKYYNVIIKIIHLMTQQSHIHITHTPRHLHTHSHKYIPLTIPCISPEKILLIAYVGNSWSFSYTINS